ncbi:MAG: 6-phosphogluconolactonase [Chitinophagaceae bacterium]|nr:6-phosphogluconolactonase [Chitinophagaceae bacterium]
MKLNVFQTEEEVLNSLAAYYVFVANRAIEKNNRFSVALSGGSSPRKLYELLSSATFKHQTDWSKASFFFGDERRVPHTSADSNYLMAKKALLDPLQIDVRQHYPVDTSLPPQEAASHYERDIADYFQGGFWKFDLVLLGLGDDAHTASLFPGSSILQDTVPAVRENYLSDKQVYRITLNAPLINNAWNVAFLVYGESKATALHQVIEGERNINQFPAQLIQPHEAEVQWFIDQKATAKLINRTQFVY